MQPAASNLVASPGGSHLFEQDEDEDDSKDVDENQDEDAGDYFVDDEDDNEDGLRIKTRGSDPH